MSKLLLEDGELPAEWWVNAPEWCKYIAIDKDGRWGYYASRPLFAPPSVDRYVTLPGERYNPGGQVDISGRSATWWRRAVFARPISEEGDDYGTSYVYVVLIQQGGAAGASVQAVYDGDLSIRQVISLVEDYVESQIEYRDCAEMFWTSRADGVSIGTVGQTLFVVRREEVQS